MKQRAADDRHGRVGRYRLEQRLGAGGMGLVYSAYDERLDRRVAVKRILPEAEEDPRSSARFLREARTAARLSHPAIVQIYDIVAEDGGDWIVMELAEGEPLDRLLAEGPLDPDRALLLAVDLAAGLAAAHAEGIVHRDLKAGNVIVTRDGRAKILDFGLAKEVAHRGGDLSLSVTGQILGTPGAMSPEQTMGREVDHRSDLFSLGTLLYELVTGIAPFIGSGLEETVTRIRTHRQIPASEVRPEVPRRFSNLVERLLEKEPCLRPQSAREVLLALKGLVGSGDAEIPGLLCAPPGAEQAVDSEAETFGGTNAQVPEAGEPQPPARVPIAVDAPAGRPCPSRRSRPRPRRRLPASRPRLTVARSRGPCIQGAFH